MTVKTNPHPLSWLPNALTTIRMLSIPLLIYGILGIAYDWPGVLTRPSVVVGLFVLAAITDFFDGFLARRWNIASDYGRMIDPIADKLLVAACLISFCIISKGQWLILVPALLIIGRDILVSGAREHAALSRIVIVPTRLAKWKATFEMLAIAVLIIWTALQSFLPIDSVLPPMVDLAFKVGVALLWLAAILSVFTGWKYFKTALRGESKV